MQSLTLQASIRDGVVVYEDSPLVQAVRSGHVLVVDEADKAPTHVTCILKVGTNHPGLQITCYFSYCSLQIVCSLRLFVAFRVRLGDVYIT